MGQDCLKSEPQIDYRETRKQKKPSIVDDTRKMMSSDFNGAPKTKPQGYMHGDKGASDARMSKDAQMEF